MLLDPEVPNYSVDVMQIPRIMFKDLARQILRGLPIKSYFHGSDNTLKVRYLVHSQVPKYDVRALHADIYQ